MVNNISNMNFSDIQMIQSMNNKNNKVTNENQYNKDMFLDLLVAQMRYQDPSSPSSEMEYISQYATFSLIEQMQNMANQVQNSNAISLIGKTVQVSNIDEEGNVQKIQGTVDNIDIKNNKVKLCINDKYYDYEEVEKIIDEKV